MGNANTERKKRKALRRKLRGEPGPAQTPPDPEARARRNRGTAEKRRKRAEEAQPSRLVYTTGWRDG